MFQRSTCDGPFGNPVSWFASFVIRATQSSQELRPCIQVVPLPATGEDLLTMIAARDHFCAASRIWLAVGTKVKAVLTKPLYN